MRFLWIFFFFLLYVYHHTSLASLMQMLYFNKQIDRKQLRDVDCFQGFFEGTDL